jgi:hypothetical protein
MTTTTTSAALVPAAPVFTNTERLALAGFLGFQLPTHHFAGGCLGQVGHEPD